MHSLSSTVPRKGRGDADSSKKLGVGPLRRNHQLEASPRNKTLKDLKKSAEGTGTLDDTRDPKSVEEVLNRESFVAPLPPSFPAASTEESADGSFRSRSLLQDTVNRFSSRKASKDVGKGGAHKKSAVAPLKRSSTQAWFEATEEDELSHLLKLVNHEEIHEHDIHLFHPHGRIRKYWDTLLLLMISYNSISIPFVLCFDFHNDFTYHDNWITRLTLAVYLLDILVTFNTGYIKEGGLILSRRQITRSYLQHWFILDLVSAIPYLDILDIGAEEFGTGSTILYTLPLLRVLSLPKIANRLEQAWSMSSTSSSLLHFAVAVLAISHWFSCIFSVLAFGDDGLERPEITPDKSVVEAYVAAYYWSIMTMTTVGFGDVPTKNLETRLFSILAMLVGASIFAYGITDGVALVAYLNIKKTQFKRKMDRINDYMKDRKLSRHLRDEVREYFTHLHNNSDHMTTIEMEILQELTGPLRLKVAIEASDRVVVKLPFFAGSEPEFILDIYSRMTSVFYRAYREVAREGDIGSEMFFITRGSVELVKGNDVIVTMGPGQHFGEMRILDQMKRHATSVYTRRPSELMVLSREGLIASLQDNPMMRARIREFSMCRFKKAINRLVCAEMNIRPTLIEACATNKAVHSFLKDHLMAQVEVESQASKVKRRESISWTGEGVNTSSVTRSKARKSNVPRLRDAAFATQIMPALKAMKKDIGAIRAHLASQVASSTSSTGSNRVFGKGERPVGL